MQAASGTTSWNKSIEICFSKGDSVVQKSEHPVLLDEASSNVTFVQDKLSKEAFNRGPVRLLNAKNSECLPEDTRGMDYNNLFMYVMGSLVYAGPDEGH